MNRRRGSILIFVLWVLITLSLLSIAVSHYSSGDMRLAKYESENIRALYLAKAGIAKMAIEFSKDDNNYDSLNEDWNKEQRLKLGSGEVTYIACDEGSRFNLNSLSLKKEHLIMLGLDDILSQAVLDYKAKKGEKGFEFAEELFLIDGMTRDIYTGIKDYITIYRGNDPKVNINTSSENILRIVLGQDPLIISKIIAYRGGNDGIPGTEDDGVFTEDNFGGIFESFGVAPDNILNYQASLGVRSNFFRVTASASFSENKDIVRHITAVMDRSGKIYSWKED